MWSTRRNWPGDVESPGERDHAALAECVIDSNIGTLYLARAGLEINAAAETCEKFRGYREDLPEAYGDLLKALLGMKPDAAARPPEPGVADTAIRKAREVLSRARAWQNHTAPLLAAVGLPQGGLAAGRRPVAVAGNLGRRRLAEGAGKVAHEEGLRGGLDAVEDVVVATQNLRTTVAKEDAYHRLCAATTSGIFSSFSYTAAYMSAVTSECRQKAFRKAYCSSDISRMLGAFAEMSAGAAAISAQCTRSVDAVADGADDFERRRRLSDSMQPEEQAATIKELIEGLQERRQRREKVHVEVQTKHAECAVDVSQAALFVGRAGTEIHGALYHCKVGKNRAENCAGSVTGITAAFALVAMMVSNAVVECPAAFNTKAVCTSAVSQLVAGMAELSSAGFLLTDSCIWPKGSNPMSVEGPPEDPVHEDDVDGVPTAPPMI